MSKALVSLKNTKVVADPTKSSLHGKKPVTKTATSTTAKAAKLYGGIITKSLVTTTSKPSKQSRQTVSKQVKEKATQAVSKR